ncbi:MAG: enoyl-CoA hydratase-related protein [Acidobacteria bacterium]|nr:enoyl-CoA hydratase-related protein [Acidobacteriota bacterium]
MLTTLTLSLDGGIATITLSRPEKRNAISPQMIDELLAALERLETDSTRVVIITGAGKAFCAGMDLDALSALAAYSPEQNLEDSRRMARLFRRLYFFPKPLIAAVNGAAIAGGTGIATMCDFTLAVPEAKFGYTEVKIGFIPALVSVFLRRQIGEKCARELLLTGRVFDAAEAHAFGLVNQVIPAEILLPRARELATSLLAASPTSLIRTKLLLRRCAEGEIDREIELAVQENAAIRSTPDFKEGLAAFLEKRPPKWSGH